MVLCRLVAVIKNPLALHGGPEMPDLLTCLENSWVRMLLMLDLLFSGLEQ
jgi:hypothetical protein